MSPVFRRRQGGRLWLIAGAVGVTAAVVISSVLAPSNTAVPSLSGTAQEGQTLSATVGTWSGTPTISYTYQWRRCDAAGANCSNISGATGSTYALATADVGSTVRVVVTASNFAPNQGTATSAASGSVSAAPAGTANIWVSASGSYSGCARSATLVAYNAATDCSWSGAYSAASSGDSVIVKGGSYGAVTMPQNRSGSPTVSFTVESGGTATLSSFESRTNGAGPSNVTYTGPVVTGPSSVDGVVNTTFDSWDFNGGGGTSRALQGTMPSSGTANLTIRNSTLHNTVDANAMTYFDGSGLIFENNRFYDAMITSGSGVHTECMYMTSTSNVILRRNRFNNCATEDVFITGSGNGTTAPNWTVENNVFQKPTGPNHNAFAFRNGGAPSPYPTNFTFRYNVVDGFQMPDSTSSATGSFIGNYFRTQAPCGWTNMVYVKNAGSSGNSCALGVTVTTSAADAGFVDPVWTTGADNDPSGSPLGNFALVSGSPLIDAGSLANYPSTDLLGASRYLGSAPDIGAYEYVP